MDINWAQFFAVAVVCLLLGGIAGAVFFPTVIEKEVVVKDVQIVEFCGAECCPDNSKLDEIHSEIFLEDAKEDVAEGLALEELDERDFKKDLLEFLNNEGASIDSYKDIDKIVVKDVDLSLAGEDCEAELELKIYFFNDGDDDEDDIEKAKLTATFEVSDLDEDEDYEDAEAELAELSLIKFY